MVYTASGRTGDITLFVFQIKGLHHRHTRLLHGGRSHGRETDYVARGVNVWHAGLILLIDKDIAMLLHFHADLFKPKCLHIALPAGSDQYDIYIQYTERFQPQLDMVSLWFDLHHFVTQGKFKARCLQLI